MFDTGPPSPPFQVVTKFLLFPTSNTSPFFNETFSVGVHVRDVFGMIGFEEERNAQDRKSDGAFVGAIVIEGVGYGTVQLLFADVPVRS